MCLLTVCSRQNDVLPRSPYPGPQTREYVIVHDKMDFADAITDTTQLALTQEEYPGLSISLSKQRTVSNRKWRDTADDKARESKHEGELEPLWLKGPHGSHRKGLSISRIKDQAPADNQQGNWNLSPIATKN